MNLNEILTEIALDFDQSASGPASSTSEYVRRVALINRAARVWAQRLNYKWHDLYKTATLTTAIATVSLPSDFMNGNLILDDVGYIKVGETYYKMIRADQKGDYVNSENVMWVTGNVSAGFVLNILPTPTSTLTFDIAYYTTNLATNVGGTEQESLVLATDITKVPNPYFIVYSVLANLFKADDDLQKGVDFERQSFDALSDMLAGQIIGNTNQDNSIPDLAEVGGYSNIGA